MAKPFRGVVRMDIRDSIPDWGPYEQPKAPDGAPNILYIVLDDVGFGALGCYGGLIDTPNIDRIAASGLRYTQWHTTALCSPTRSCLLTGRNHTTNGMACISEAAIGFPGGNGHVPPECATLAEILVDRGFSTAMVGKWHLCAEDEMNLASTKRNWPVGRGFERFYGFLGAETNEWYPDLVHDNHPVDQPSTPAEGYHLSVDLTDKAIEFIDDVKSIAPDRPVFLYYALGATHAPHQVPKEWVDRYRGRFDVGYEAIREQILARQKQMGIVPQNTELPPINPIGTPDSRTSPQGAPFPLMDFTRPWASLNDDEKRLFARMAEVYAGFLSHADDQIGRLLDFLATIEQLDNTIIVVVSDNGASGEGGPNGSVNENKMANGIPDDLDAEPGHARRAGRHEDLQPLSRTGGRWPSTRRSRCGSGTRSTAAPATRASSPGREASRPAARCVTSTTTPSTSCRPCSTASASSCRRPSTATPRCRCRASACATASTRPPSRARRTPSSISMLGTRGIWQDGWKAVTTHPAISGWGHFASDTWELYHTDVDRSELHDLAAEEPEKLAELIGLWFYEAGANQAFPLDDRSAVEIVTTPRPQLALARNRYVYRPGFAEVPESVAVNIRNRSYSIGALVDIPGPGAPGGAVLARQPVRWARALRQGQPAALRVQLRRQRSSRRSARPRTCRRVTTSSCPPASTRPARTRPASRTARSRLFYGDRKVGEGQIRTQPGKFTIAGEGLNAGRDSGEPVTDDYPGTAPWAFTGGTLHRVAVDVSGEPYVDLEREAVAMMSRE